MIGITCGSGCISRINAADALLVGRVVAHNSIHWMMDMPSVVLVTYPSALLWMKVVRGP